MNDVKEMVSAGKRVKFLRYRVGEFIYSTECGFEFPVPLLDLGTATLLAEDKAILFLRYIRKHVDLKVEEENNPEMSARGAIRNRSGKIIGYLR